MGDYAQALELTRRDDTCVHSVTSKQHITLNPKFIGQIAKGVREVLNGQLNLYSDRLEGVPIAFGKVSCKKSYANIMDEQPFLHLDCQAEAILFRPTLGSRLTGVVNKLGHDHVGCLVHHVFNAAIHKPRGGGVDGGDSNTWAGAELRVGQEVVIEVTKLHIFNGVVSIRGKLVESRDVPDFAVATDATPQPAKKKNKKKKSDAALAHSFNLPMVATPSKDTENDSIGSLDSGLGALTPPPESAGQNPPPFNESAHASTATSSAKKKKKTRKESVGVAGQVDNDNVDSMTMQSAIKTEEASVEGTPSSSKKKKKKKSLEKADELGQPELNTSVVMDDGDIKSEHVETPVSSKKKKKHNKTLDTSQLELSSLESQPSALVPTSSSKKKKKKSKHRDDFIDDLPVESFSIKTEAPGSDGDNDTSLPVSTFQLDPVPAEAIKVESHDNHPEESSKKKKRKRKRDDSLNMTIAGGETFTSPPAKKKKKHRQSLP